MFYLAGKLRIRIPGPNLSVIALSNSSEYVREDPGYIGVLAIRTRQLEHQKTTVN